MKNRKMLETDTFYDVPQGYRLHAEDGVPTVWLEPEWPRMVDGVWVEPIKESR